MRASRLLQCLLRIVWQSRACKRFKDKKLTLYDDLKWARTGYSIAGGYCTRRRQNMQFSSHSRCPAKMLLMKSSFRSLWFMTNFSINYCAASSINFLCCCFFKLEEEKMAAEKLKRSNGSSGNAKQNSTILVLVQAFQSLSLSVWER